MKKSAPEKGGTKKKEKKAKKKKGVLQLFRWGTVLPIALLLAAGIALFAVPAENMRVLSFATGVVLSLAAVFLVVSAFLGSASVLRVVCGAALAALAVWLFVRPEEAGGTLYYVLTGVVLLRALVGLFYALVAKRKESRLWQISMAGSVFLLIAAVVYFFLPMLDMSGQNLLLGILCCLDAFFESVALLHRLTQAKEENPEKKPQAKEENTEKKPRAKEENPEKKPQAKERPTPQESEAVFDGAREEEKDVGRKKRKKREK